MGREAFAELVIQRIRSRPLITRFTAEVTDLPREPAVIASGPLTSPALEEAIARFSGQGHLSFFDAMAPIVSAESIDMRVAFRAARYGRGGEDYQLPHDARGL